jgi:hypothetical protein
MTGQQSNRRALISNARSRDFLTNSPEDDSMFVRTITISTV